MEQFVNYPLVLFGVCLIGFSLWLLYDIGKELFRFEPPPPPEDLTKVWVEVDPDRFLQKAVHMKSTAYGVGVYTHVYMYKKTGEIRGTVTPMKNGLWNAMMYNGRQNVFYTDKLAKEWVENYKPHIVK